MAQRHTNRLASYLVLITDNQVLLLRRANTGYNDGNYSMPAGHVDPDESFSQTILREVDEEIGIQINSTHLSQVHTQHRRAEDGQEYVDTYFTATKWTGEITNMEPHKCDDLSWHPLDNLPPNTIPYIKYVLQQISQHIPYSEYGWN